MILPQGTKAVLFDMDGVIFNTEDIAHKVLESFAERCGRQFTEDHHKAILGTSESYWSKFMCDQFQLGMMPEEFSRQFWNERNKLVVRELKVMDGALAAIDKIREQGIKIALVTNSPRKQATILLDRFNLCSRFSVIVTGDEVKRGKPNPEPYLKAVCELGLQACECIVVEDTISGVKSGKRAGCYVIAVPTIHAIGLDYSEADRIIQSLEVY